MDITNFSPDQLFIGLIILAAIETVIRKWLPHIYYRVGIPILKRTASPPSSQFNFNQFPETHTQPHKILGQLRVQTHHLSDGEIALSLSSNHENKPFWKRKKDYNPATHAYIKADLQADKLELIVYLNWMIIPFFLLWFSAALFLMPIVFLKIPFALLGIVVIYRLIDGEFNQYLEVWEEIQSTSH